MQEILSNSGRWHVGQLWGRSLVDPTRPGPGCREMWVSVQRPVIPSQTKTIPSVLP
jgi:hypothetical protein